MTNENFIPLHDVPPGSIGWRGSRDYILSPEDIPNVEDLVIEDGKPVDNLFVEKEYRLLTEPLYSSWSSPSGEFLALANVGLFYAHREPPLVPDVMLSLGVPASRDLTLKENRSYFTWIIGKPPDVVIQIVSDLRGGEETDKMVAYARIGVTYYVIHDPRNRLHHGLLRTFYLSKGKYEPLEAPWLENIGLGLTFWEGEFQGQQHPRWLRWCDRDGVVIPTGLERAEQEKQRAEQEKQRAERFAAQLRALGVEPDA
ncbi:MAG: Uma2 family endonuclease [Gemmataceae bacterium]